jgi:type I restriction enzyme S subunit
MSEWKEYKLSEIADFIDYRGKTPTKTTSGVPLITAKIVKNGTIQEPTEFISIDDYPKWMVRGFPKVGDVVLTTEAPLGEVAQIKDASYALAQRIITIRGKDGLMSNGYLKYFLQSEKGQQRLKERETGTTVTGIKSSELKQVQISAPSLPTQTAIAEILSSLDDKIELNNKINKELETLAQTLFKQWFIDFEFPNENGEPYKSSGGEMVESELGEIPKGWEVASIDDISEIVTKGTTPTSIGGKFTESGINFIKVESLTESGTFIKSKFAHIDDETNQLLKRSIIKSGDVLFSIAGTIGRVAVVTDEILPANTNQAIAIIRPNKISSYFLKILMQSSLIQNDTHSNIVQAVQANLSLGVIKATKFILPPTNILSKIDIQLDSIYDNINHITLENENLTTLRDNLLPKLISGELEINEIAN